MFRPARLARRNRERPFTRKGANPNRCLRLEGLERRLLLVAVPPGTFVSDITVDTEFLDTSAPYVFAADLTIRSGATLTVGTGVTVQINNAVDLDIEGRMRVDNASQVGYSDSNNHFTSASTSINVLSRGVLEVNNTDFVLLTNSAEDVSSINVLSGGRFTANGSDFGIDRITWFGNSLLDEGDVVGNVFGAVLELPAEFIPRLDSTNPLFANDSFNRVEIRGEPVTADVTLRQMGTVTNSNLVYRFIADVDILEDTNLTFMPGTTIEVNNQVDVNVRGTLFFDNVNQVGFFDSNSHFTSATTGIRVASRGTLEANNTNFVLLTNANEDTSLIDVQAGGRLLANGTDFGIDRVRWQGNSLLDPGNVVNNHFDAVIELPAEYIPRLDSDDPAFANDSFDRVEIRGETVTADVMLRQMGTDSTANLVYRFIADLLISTDVSLTFEPGTTVEIGNSVDIDVDGELLFDNVNQIGFFDDNNHFTGSTTRIRVNDQGVLEANQSDFVLLTNGGADRSILEIDSGGRFFARRSDIQIKGVFLGSQSQSTLVSNLIEGPFSIDGDASLIARNNDFAGASVSASGPANQVIDLSCNWWGTVNATAIESLVLHRVDDASRALIDFEPILTSRPDLNQLPIPKIAWPEPSDIVYGTALGAGQLNAVADVPGAFTYSPSLGTVLDAGTYTLMATFTPADPESFQSTVVTRTLNVLKADPVFVWNTPAPIRYGTPLGNQQLNAFATAVIDENVEVVAGQYVYTPAAGTLLSPGMRPLSATFTPDDTDNFNTAPNPAPVTIEVLKNIPSILWDDPADIVYGTRLDATQLVASASAMIGDETVTVAGTFTYDPTFGSVLPPGQQVINANFQPTDATLFDATTAQVNVFVNPADVSLTWNPDQVIYGNPLSDSQLNATATAMVGGVDEVVSGAFTYDPPEGAVINPGDTLSLVFVPDDEARFNRAEILQQAIDVVPASPSIDWVPADLIHGSPLGGAQLNATATGQVGDQTVPVSGSFLYDPADGTFVDPSVTLTATFTPDDATRFREVTVETLLNVVDNLDYGDAPNSYRVTRADDGPRHVIGSIFLGSAIDRDDDGQTSDDASGDDTNNDDEDGVVSIATLLAVDTATTTSSFSIEATESGKIDAWVDFNGDGQWDDESESVLSSVDVVAGFNLLSFSVPAGATSGETFARFRISTDGDLGPTGPASDGEVEDHAISLINGTTPAPATVRLEGNSATVSVENREIVVRARNTLLFRAPGDRLNLLNVIGAENDATFQLDTSNDFSVMAGALQIHGGEGSNTIAVSGQRGTLSFLTDPSGAANSGQQNHVSVIAENFDTIDLSGNDFNTVSLDAATVALLSPESNVIRIVGGQGDGIDVRDSANWRMAAPLTIDNEFILTAETSASGGSESIEVNLPHAWQNFLQAGDVNNDGAVTALDALRIMNELARRAFSDRDTQALDAPESLSAWPGVYFDHNGDDQATALDALRVINDLARQNSLGQTEAESWIPAAISPMKTVIDADWQQSEPEDLEPLRKTLVQPAGFIRQVTERSRIVQTIDHQETSLADAVDKSLNDVAFLQQLMLSATRR